MIKFNELKHQLKQYRNILNCPLRGYGVTANLLAFEWRRINGYSFTPRQLVAAFEYGILEGYEVLNGKGKDLIYAKHTKSDSPLKKRKEFLAKRQRQKRA